MTWQEHEQEYLKYVLDEPPVHHYGVALTYADANNIADNTEEDEYWQGPTLEIAKCTKDGKYYVIAKPE